MKKICLFIVSLLFMYSTKAIAQDAKVESGLMYYYEVVAVNACSVSGVSDRAVSSPSAPSPPTGVSADSSGNCQVTVTWDWPEDWPDDNPASFNIYRGIEADPLEATINLAF